MNKIICDVCGTSYPETATQCPICGCVRPGDVHTVEGEPANQSGVAESTGYTYVKGGRFSKSNVKKRMRTAHNGVADGDQMHTDEPEKTSKKDVGLLITVAVLLLAIIAVVIYIVVHFFVPANTNDRDPVDQTTAAQTTAADETTSEPTQLEIPCEELLLEVTQVRFDSVDASMQLDVQMLPADTTDELYFESSDPSVVTVSADGLLTAVADGTAEIRIVCGDAEVVCEVICSISEETTPTEETTEPTTEPEEVFELNREDFSLFFVGDSWNVYSGELDPKTITWSSKNEKVVTVKDGVVEAVGPGDTIIYGEYNGTKISCAVHCKFKVDSVQPEPDEPTSTGTPDCIISHSDVTLKLDGTESQKSFVIMLKDANDLPVTTVTWRCDEPYCTINGSIIKAASRGTAKVYTTYNGYTYSCIVRVQ